MSYSIAFFTKEYTFFPANSFLPFLCDRQHLETSFYLVQTNFSSLCFCYEFNTTNLIVIFLQHCWSCTKCREYTKYTNSLYFFSWEESLAVDQPAVGELPILISSLKLLWWEQSRFSHHSVCAKKNCKCLSK